MGLSHLDPEILRMPLLEAIAVGCLSGLVGTLMVMGKRVFFAESLSHGIFPGAVLGVVVANLLSLDLSTGLMVGAALFCLPLAWLMRWLSTVEGISSTAAAGVTLTLGFSLGILLLRWFQPLPIHVDSFLVGSLTTVNAQDVWFVGALVVVSLGVLVAFRRTLVSFYFDQTSFRAQGGKPGRYDLLTLTLISVTMVVVIPAVGTIVPGAAGSPGGGVAAVDQAPDPAHARCRYRGHCAGMRRALAGGRTQFVGGRLHRGAGGCVLFAQHGAARLALNARRAASRDERYARVT